MFQEVGHLRVLHAAGCKVPAVLDDNTAKFETPQVSLYFVMEHIEGQTLAELVKASERLPLDLSIAITREVAATVSKGLEHGVVHRDVKPENLVVRSQDPADVVVVDYGLSFNAAEPTPLTTTSETIDNKFLSLPERRIPGGDRRDPRSDLTGVSAVLFYCLTGKPPVDLVGPKNEAPHRRDGSSLRDILGDGDHLAALESFFDCAFSSDLDARFQTSKELIDRLDSILSPKMLKPPVDPVTFAKEAAERFRKRDRKTQLAEFAKVAEKVIGSLVQTVAEFRGGVVAFTVHPSRGGAPSEERMPEGTDHVPVTPFCVAVGHEHHAVTRAIWYCARGKGSQCAICRCTRDGTSSAPSEWEPIYWYDGMHEPPAMAMNELDKDVEAMVVMCMQSIEQEVLRDSK